MYGNGINIPNDINNDMAIQGIKSSIDDVVSEKVKEQRLFVKNKFFPALCEATESIHDADVFLQSFSSMIMDVFLQSMKDKRFEDLNLASKLDMTSPKYLLMTTLIHLFDGMSLRESQDLIDGMKAELRSFYEKEMRSRKLNSLEVNWL